MDILILGNGFDLAHGLKTTYKDFLDYCYKQLNKVISYKPSAVDFQSKNPTSVALLGLPVNGFIT